MIEQREKMIFLALGGADCSSRIVKNNNREVQKNLTSYKMIQKGSYYVIMVNNIITANGEIKRKL